jgi:hypothetical protein
MNNLADKIDALAERATPGPWVAYGEPEVGLPPTLFAGTPGETGFDMVEPLQGYDLALIVELVNARETLTRALRDAERMREALREALGDLWEHQHSHMERVEFERQYASLFAALGDNT